MVTERPLLAESGPSFHPISADLNGRFREKRTLGLALAVKIAEPIALGRKQTFIPRPRVLSIGDGILLAALCRTQTAFSINDSIALKRLQGPMRE